MRSRILDQRRARRARLRREAGVPLATELLAGSLRAGLTTRRAVDVVAEWGPPAVAQVMGAALRDRALGRSDSEILRDLRRTHAELAPLIDLAITSAERGAPVAHMLVALAADARRAARDAASARVRAASVMLLFPLTLLVLPAFFALVLGPALAVGFSRL